MVLSPALALSRTAAPTKQARIGLIGVGLRGTNHLKNLLKRDDVLIPAICDIDAERINIALELVTKAGFKKPETFTNGLEAFRQMLTRNDLEGIIIGMLWVKNTNSGTQTSRFIF